MKPEHGDRRADFVIEMYRVYWANMARSMEGIWKILAPITVAGTIVAGVHQDYLPAPVGISFAFVVVLWALNVTIDLNAWHRRNLMFLTKAEQQFLKRQDYGNLVPVRYSVPSDKWVTFYRINAWVFGVLLLLCVLYGAIWKLKDSRLCGDWLLPAMVLVGGFVLTGINYCAQEKSARDHFNELFGPAKSSEKFQEKASG